MKKISLLLLILFILPLRVSAASINVKSLDINVDGKTINYSGEMEDGSVAVMCKLYSGDDEIDYLSSAVNSNKFEGSFVVSSEGTYKVYCANYEGGEFKSAEVEVKTSTETNEETPNTLDNILTFVIIASVSIIAVVSIELYFKKVR